MTPGRLALAAALAIAALAASASPARAQCSVWSVTGVAFGGYDVFNPDPVDSTGRIQLVCWPPQRIQVTLSRGSAPTYSPRRMTSGGETLAYNLFRDAARSVIWGDGSGGTQFYQGNGWIFSLTIYGRVTPAQNAAVGSYTDQIVAVINF